MGKKKLDFDPEKREQIVFHRHYDPEIYRAGYGICKFDKLPYYTVKELLDNGYITNHDYLDMPDAEEFIKFVEEHDPEKWYFHGYVVMAERVDTRITIEGIGSYKPLDKDGLIDFLQMYRMADELDAEKNKHCTSKTKDWFSSSAYCKPLENRMIWGWGYWQEMNNRIIVVV